MSNTIDEATKKEIMNFRELLDPLVKYIKDTWDYENFKPKNYEEHIKSYEEFDQHNPNPAEFTGLLDESHCSFPFPERSSFPQVALADTAQGHSPLESIIGSVLAYGIQVGEKRRDFQNQGYAKRFDEDIDDIVGWVERISNNTLDDIPGHMRIATNKLNDIKRTSKFMQGIYNFEE